MKLGELLLDGPFKTAIRHGVEIVDFTVRGCQFKITQAIGPKALVCGKTVDCKIVSRVMMKAGQEVVALSGICAEHSGVLFADKMVFHTVPRKAVYR